MTPELKINTSAVLMYHLGQAGSDWSWTMDDDANRSDSIDPIIVSPDSADNSTISSSKTTADDGQHQLDLMYEYYWDLL